MYKCGVGRFLSLSISLGAMWVFVDAPTLVGMCGSQFGHKQEKGSARQ